MENATEATLEGFRVQGNGGGHEKRRTFGSYRLLRNFEKLPFWGDRVIRYVFKPCARSMVF